MNNSFATKYTIKCELKTALHIGCGEDSPIGAADIYKNGAGEFCIPGTTIAGLFFDTLESIYPDISVNSKTKNLWYKCTQNENGDSYGSPIIFRTSILETKENLVLKIRDRTKINATTKTAEEGGKFSYWEIGPENVNFEINIAIDRISVRFVSDEDNAQLEEWIEAVLYSWQNEEFMIGAFCSSGNGWTELTKVLKDDKEITLNTPENYTNIYDHYNLNVKVDDEENGYGTNALLIKGGDSNESLNPGNFVDGIFVNTGKKLYIPGSSIKGVFSFFMEKYGQEEWAKLLGVDLANDKKALDYAGDLFIQDLFPEEYQNNHLISIERHAEDEFTRAVFGTSKFNEERVFHTTFSGKILIRKSTRIDKNRIAEKEISDMIDFIKQGMSQRLISLGANGCYPLFSLQKINPSKEENNA